MNENKILKSIFEAVSNNQPMQQMQSQASSSAMNASSQRDQMQQQRTQKAKMDTQMRNAKSKQDQAKVKADEQRQKDTANQQKQAEAFRSAQSSDAGQRQQQQMASQMNALHTTAQQTNVAQVSSGGVGNVNGLNVMSNNQFNTAANPQNKTKMSGIYQPMMGTFDNNSRFGGNNNPNGNNQHYI